MTISFHPLTCPLNQRLWSQKCFSSVISPSKTVFSLVWWVSLCRDASLWGEAFIRAQHHPRAVYQRLNLTLTVAAGCHVRSYVCWKCGLVSLKTFPPSGPCFHCLFQTQFFKQGYTGEEGGKKNLLMCLVGNVWLWMTAPNLVQQLVRFQFWNLGHPSCQPPTVSVFSLGFTFHSSFI